jgi:hypothetical protein
VEEGNKKQTQTEFSSDAFCSECYQEVRLIATFALSVCLCVPHNQDPIVTVKPGIVFGVTRSDRGEQMDLLCSDVLFLVLYLFVFLVSLQGQ